MLEGQAYLDVMGAAVMGLATDAVFVLDAQTLQLLQANRAFSRVFGYSAAEATSLSLYDVAAGERSSIQNNLARLNAEGQVDLGVRPYRRKDGSIVEMESRAGETTVGARRVFGVILRDLTERRRAEHSLAESEERFRKLTEAAFEGIAITEGGRFIDANARMAEILGAPLDQLLDRPVSDFVAPESREKVAAHMNSGSEQPYEHVALRADGSPFPVEVQAKAIQFGGRTMRVTALRDVSIRRSLEEQVRLAQRMESVGRLAGGVAHDFNNLLTVILSAVKLMNESPRSEKDRDDLSQIEGAAERAAELTRQLLAFARRQIVQPRTVDLNAVTANIERILRRVIGEDIQLTIVPARDLSTIRADPGQVEQVLMNLAVNARDAMPSGGRLTIETANVTLSDGYAAAHPEVTPGEYVMVSVTDTGIGMDRATLAHIFEPFFTTKPAGVGTGLGLATCYGIVKQAGGSIWVYSEPRKGTTFKVYFPRIQGVVAAEETRPAAISAAGTETVLMVEDDAMVRRIAIRILRSQGYTVHEADDAEQALARFEELGGKVDLLITDVIMPGTSGKDLADELHRRCPALKVLYTSGYTENTIVDHGVVDAGVSFLAKPYVPAALIQRVREVLDR